MRRKSLLQEVTVRKTDWLESFDFRLLLKVRQLILHIVHRHSSLLPLKPFISPLRHSLVSPVPGLEEDGRGPVVAKVVGGLARCACGELCGIHDFGAHVGDERVPADDLVQVGRGSAAWLDEGIQPVDDELGAAETD